MKTFPFFFAGFALAFVSCQHNKSQTTTNQASVTSQYLDSMPIASLIPASVAKYQQIIESGHDINQLNDEGTTYLVQLLRR